MLVLTRKEGQEILIGPDIKIMVTRIVFHPDGKSVQIGIDAPKDVEILRPEAIKKRPSHEDSRSGS